MCFVECIVGIGTGYTSLEYLNQHSDQCDMDSSLSDFSAVYKASKSTAVNLYQVSAVLLAISVCGLFGWCYFRRKVFQIQCRSAAELEKTFGSKGYLRYVTVIFLAITGIFLVFWIIALVLLLFLDSNDFDRYCSHSFVSNSTFTSNITWLKIIVYPVLVAIVILFITYACMTRCCCICINVVTDTRGNNEYECFCVDRPRSSFCYLFC